jgi:hypothetical protein
VINNAPYCGAAVSVPIISIAVMNMIRRNSQKTLLVIVVMFLLKGHIGSRIRSRSLLLLLCFLTMDAGLFVFEGPPAWRHSFAGASTIVHRRVCIS